MAKPGRKKKSVEDRLDDIHFDFQKIEEIAGLGFTDVQIANILDITEMTINRWKKDPAFLLALKRGKDRADSQVVKSLYQRATGYDDTKAIYFSAFQGTVTETPYTKHYAPDVTAQIFWLKNRQSEAWRDRVDLTTKDQPIGTNQTLDVSKIPADTLLELSKALRRIESLQSVNGNS